MTQRIEWESRFAYTEDGGNPLYRGSTSLEGQECLRNFYQSGKEDWEFEEPNSKEFVDF